MKNISQKLSNIMEIYNKSYGEIANATGIPKSAIHRYVTGETGNIPLDRLEMIASYLSIGMPYLLGWDKSKEYDYVKRFHDLGYRYNQNAREDGFYSIDEYANFILNNLEEDRLHNLNQDPYSNYIDHTSFNEKNTYGDHKANLDHLSDKPELLDIYNDIYESENLQLLFDTARDLTPEELEAVLNVIKMIHKGE